jgi:predicted DNA binding CopG/RHH family protein
VLEDPRHSRQEPRFRALGKTDDARLLHSTFTRRHTRETIRVISARDRHRKERASYEKQPKSIPKFANQTEEREFWEEHDSSEYLDWSKAESVVMPNLKPTTKTISLRLPQHLLDSIKAAANARDVPYQSLIKVRLQETLHGH